ncbi:MAG TPA: class I SAM-dependent methyltransferase [Bacillota bacterium]|jgi:SAM-dependent methyltransferase|nr:class I SAM-dependent methyltransferase [Fastidiosipila sp.]HPX92782.1 class I SAM-dependent methyltransferase [Bacillota bacterium]HQB81659.1 class I SAM-dependent methyltransferase [Bacillota bacterium]
MSKEYGHLSTLFYELTKPVGCSLDGDIDYYSKKCEKVTGRILEAGVGTGRILIPLIGRGHTVDGVDSSADMLEQCRSNLERHQVKALLYEQDLADLSLPHRYDAIIMPAGTFCLLPGEKVKEVLRNFHQHLNAGGQIILDLEMPVSFKAGQTSTSRFPMTEDRELIFTSHSENIDWLNQKTSFVNRYELIQRGKVMMTETAHLVLYWYGIREFEMLLSHMHFKDISHETGYGKEVSAMVTFTATKDA